jgi:hypothetical protein
VAQSGAALFEPDYSSANLLVDLQRKPERFSQPREPKFPFLLSPGPDTPRPPPPEPSNDEFCDLHEGDSKIVPPSVTPIGAYSTQGYKLVVSKDPESGLKIYDVIINFKFSPAPGDSPNVVDDMKKIATNCFDAVGIIRGPDGDGMRIRFANEKDQGLPAEYPLQVTAKVLDRENSKMWSTSSRLGCAMTIHETMHELGLGDIYLDKEYKVKAPDGSMRTLYNCRSTGAESIMGDNLQLILNYSQPYYTFMTCKCNVWGKCNKDFAKLSGVPQECPAGSTIQKNDQIFTSDFYLKTHPELEPEFESKVVPSMKGQYDGGRYNVTVKNVPRADFSILYPAEFRAVVHPFCHAKNETYYRCTYYSYWSDFQLKDGVCGKEAICDSPAWLK